MSTLVRFAKARFRFGSHFHACYAALCFSRPPQRAQATTAGQPTLADIMRMLQQLDQKVTALMQSNARVEQDVRTERLSKELQRHAAGR